jgi:precorrin-3B C17-methyltransferase
MSRRAHDALQCADAVFGYTTYIELIRPLIGDKTVVATAMKKEVDRVEAAIEAALTGKRCAVVSSGDAGIYAMAGLIFEMCREKQIQIVAAGTQDNEASAADGLAIEVIPGIPALAAGAALLGAPLTHDFAAISLSDLLTPWETIEKRLKAAAEANFVMVIYNPKSKKRDWQLKKAQEIALQYRDEDTPVGIVTGAMRENQRVEIVPLKALHTAQVGMQTTVFIGNQSTFCYMDRLVTPRGYSKKYNLQ